MIYKSQRGFPQFPPPAWPEKGHGRPGRGAGARRPWGRRG